MPKIALPRVLTPPVADVAGISRSRVRTELRRGNWRWIAPGIVLTRPDEPTREDWADVGVYLGGPGSALTGWDALRARGLGDRRPCGPVVVVTPSGMNRVVGGVRIRRTRRPFDRRPAPLGAPYELVPLVPVARAVADTALDLDLRSTQALVTSIVQRDRCTIAQLKAEYEAGPRNRSATLRLALSDVLDGARSAAEAMAARRLAAGPVPAFELNVPVVDAVGNLLYVLDEFWRELRAGVEIDSREHHFSEADWERTMVRHNALARRGIALLHYSPALVTCRGSRFVPDVAEWLACRAAELGVALPRGRGVRRPPPGAAPAPFVLGEGAARDARLSA